MLYALFDNEGKVVGLTETAQPNTREVSLRDPEVLEFLSMNSGENFDPDAFLDSSDKGTIRILEDLIDTLVGLHLIRFTDLPLAAQKKLLGRKLARKMVREESGVVEEAEIEHQGSILLDDSDSIF